ncbi:MAG: hypothetical protein IT487_10130 [Chromatiaceae bacterium]|nr:hypothetical protein [Chromatiaceae bacterium]
MRGKWLSTRLPAKGAGNVASKEGALQGQGASRETTKEKRESSHRDFTPCETDGLVLPAHSALCLGQDPPMTPQRLPSLIDRSRSASSADESDYAFSTPDQLMQDFQADIARWNHEYGRS